MVVMPRPMTKSPTFEEGVSRWVGPEEAQLIAAGLADCRTSEDVVAWAREYPAGRLLSGVDGGLTHLEVRFWLWEESPLDLAAMVVMAVGELAARRRHHAVAEWARDRRMSLPHAMATTARCPTCGKAIDVRLDFDAIYCRDHRANERAEILELARIAV